MRKNKLGLRAVVAVISLTVIITAAALADSARDIAKRVSPSVVLLVIEDASGQPLAMASGFVVREAVVATNMHVIEGAARGYAKPVGQNLKHDVLGVVASDPARDLVLLAVDGLKADQLAIGDSSQVAVGDEVYAVGNPGGLEGTFSAGIVSSVRKVAEDSLLQITAPISPGSSGGPVVNSMGQVIGVAVATFEGGQNLNFAIPSQYLSALIPLIEAAVPLQDVTEAARGKKGKSILDDLGGRSTQGVTAAGFLWTSTYGQTGDFSFSLRNELREPVQDVACLVVFYGNDGGVLDAVPVTFPGMILPGLAKRITGEVDKSVQKLTTPIEGESPKTKLEFRILYFGIVNPEEATRYREFCEKLEAALKGGNFPLAKQLLEQLDKDFGTYTPPASLKSPAEVGEEAAAKARDKEKEFEKDKQVFAYFVTENSKDKALDKFRQLKERYPDHPYVQEAEKELAKKGWLE